MAEAIRNLQLFRNGAPIVGNAEYVKEQIENALTLGSLTLHDGEPISVRYHELVDDSEGRHPGDTGYVTTYGDIKGLYGVGYVDNSDPNNPVTSVLWSGSDVNVVADNTNAEYVTIGVTENPDGTFNVSGDATTVSIDEATEQNNGLATAYDVKQHLSGVGVYNEGHDINFRTVNGVDGTYIDTALDEAIEASVTVGNLTSGTTIPANASLSDILNMILVKEFQAKPNAPTNTISVNCNSQYSVGEYLGELTISRTFNGGSYGPTTGYSSAKFIQMNGANPLPANCEATGTTYKFDGTTITLTDGKYDYGQRLTEGEHNFSCTTTYDGSSVIPKTNLGNDSTATGIPIASGTTSQSKATFNVYHNVYVKIVETLPADYSTILSETASKHAITRNDVLADVVYEIPGYNKMIIMLPQAKTFYIKNEFNVDSESEYSLMTTVTDSATNVTYNVYVKINDAGAIAKYQNLRFANA